MWTLLAVAAFAGDEFDPEPAPAPDAPAAPTTPPTSATPTLTDLRGTWFVTSPVDGKEAVAWACKGNPISLAFDQDTLVVSAGAEPLGAAIRSHAARGDALVLTTTLEACGGAKEMTVKWADPAHKILEITRCEGTPRTVRVVRDVASGVPVMRACCDANGKVAGWVATEAGCPGSTQGQKPTPLRR